MKWILILSLLTMVTFAPHIAASQTPDAMLLGARVCQIKDRIEAQIERIKRAREDAESSMDVARTRVGEQLRVSEEKLALQIERLIHYQDMLGEQLTETKSSVCDAQGEWLRMLESVKTEVKSQISGAKGLIERLRTVRERVENGDNATFPGQSGTNLLTKHCPSPDPPQNGETGTKANGDRPVPPPPPSLSPPLPTPPPPAPPTPVATKPG